MDTVETTAPASRKLLWAGYIATALPVLLLLFSAFGKFFKPEGMEANILPLGWKMEQMTWLGIVELSCVIIYLIPQTAVFGAVLLTAYLGGATAAHARIGEPYFIPIIAGVLVWVGIYLREARLWDLAPLRK